MLLAAVLVPGAGAGAGSVAGSGSASPAEHWSYVPPRLPEPPAVAEESWVRNPIDRFVLARLEKEGLPHSPEADAETLARRVSLDLTGLPPTPEELSAFLADDSPGAYERYVDRLLASPHFGEQWARHWLDLARYADSDGFSLDLPREIWPYRDWVVDAFNRDMPFDRFTIDQLAGDLLPDATRSDRIATGFQRNTMVNSEAGVDDEEFRVEAVKDRVNTAATVWLGTTLACAQCHDHKYDPFTQVDYYRMFAFFDDTVDGGTQPGGLLDLPTEEEKAERQRVQAEIEELQGELLGPAPELDAPQHAWERDTLAADAAWSTLTPVTAESDGGVRLEPRDDGSLLAVGPAPERARYSLTLAPGGDAITALRLEVLPDPSLPGGGPGRAPDGNFTLTEVRLRVLPGGGAAPGPPLPFGEPTASHEQRLSIADFWPVDAAVDGETITGWAVAPHLGRLHEAVFPLARPLRLREGERLLLELDQQRGDRYTIGRLRVSVSDAAPPPAARSMDALDLRTVLGKPDAKRSPAERKSVREHFRRTAAETAPLRHRIEDLRAELPRPVSTLVMKRVAEPRTTHVLRRGNFLSPGPVVKPDVPAVLPPLHVEGRTPTRLDLARWLVSPDQPLTHRVLVNRIWQRLFGTGLVKTENDFGTRGSPPTHPALLDWLAAHFVADGQSIKRLIRLVVTSSTYRQSSELRPDLVERDPGNRLLARQARFRVNAEVVRDSALVASGLLDERIGGPPVQPPQPADTDLFATLPKAWVASEGGDRYRRSLYTRIWRTNPHTFLATFDFPSPTSTCTRRNRSNTPLQALALANDPMVLELAEGLARRVLIEEHASDQERLRSAFRLCLARDPDPREEGILLDVLRSERSEEGCDPAAVEALGEVSPPEGVAPGEFVAWTAVARVLFNLDEFLTRE